MTWPALAAVVGLPVVAGATLASILYGLSPADSMAAWLLHPAAVAGAALVGQLWYVGYGAGVAAVTDRETIGLANAVTLVRGVLYAVVAGFVVAPANTAWTPALCYGFGVVLDWLDGRIARTVGRETDMGARLDMAVDAFGFVAAPLVAVHWGQLPAWYLSLSAARYIFVAGVWWRRRRGLPVAALPEDVNRRRLAGVQMVFLTLVLAPPTPPAFVYAVAPVLLALSLALFGRDYLAVSGRLDSE